MQRSTKSTVIVAALALAAFVTSFTATTAGQERVTMGSSLDSGGLEGDTAQAAQRIADLGNPFDAFVRIFRCGPLLAVRPGTRCGAGVSAVVG